MCHLTIKRLKSHKLLKQQYSFSVGNHIYMESKILMYIIFITIAMSLFLIGVYTLISCLFKSTTTSLVITITLYLMVNLFSQNLHKINYFIGFLKASSASRISIKIYSSLFNCFNCSTEIFMRLF